MVMEGIGFGLAVLAEVRTTVSSIKERIARYKEGPKQFEKVDGSLLRVIGLAEQISTVLKENPEVLRKQILGVFLETLSTVKESLVDAHSKLETVCSRLFSGSISGIVRAAVLKGSRFFRGKSLDKLVREVETEILKVEGLLQH